MSIEYTPNFDTCYTDYLELPKGFGAVESGVLFKFADLNAKYAASVPVSASGRFHATAGSAYIEAVLTQSFSEDAVDTRLDCLADAAQHLRAAADVEYDFLERGIIHPNDQDKWQRAELQYDFMDVYRDLVCGEVTGQTRNEILEKLDRRIEYTKYFAGKGYLRAEGFLGELLALRSVWKAHQSPLDRVAFPSTVRGGDGASLPHQTHDIVIATTTNGQDRLYVEAEVKAGLGLGHRDLVRYASILFHMNVNGVGHVYDPL